MKLIFNRILLVALLCSASISIAFGQASADKTVEANFRLFGWDLSLSNIFYDAKKDTAAGVEVLDGFRSDFYTYKGSPDLVFFRIETDSEGKQVKVPVFSVNIEGSGKFPLIVVAGSSSGNTTKYIASAIPDDPASFPFGSYKFVNLSSLPIAVNCGAEVFKLAAGDAKMLTPKLGTDRTTIYTNIVAATSGGVKSVYGNNWAYNPEMRTLVFVRNNPDSAGLVAARRIVDSRGSFVTAPLSKGNQTSTP